MKKSVLHLWLIAALVCGLSLSVTSCKDDDDDNGGNGDTELEVAPADTEEAKAAYNWLINMTNVEEFTDDWASKTYEPTIGVESKNDANTRVVVVANIDYARMNFSSISGINPDLLSSTQSQTIDGVGTITWTPSGAGASNLATVEVNTKLIPHLSKIVYCTVDQVGDNGSDFAGTAYFRFGDVIEDSEGYYWVCVKPAFGTGSSPQQQGYWINILNRDPTNGRSKNGTGNVPDIPKGNICSDYNEKYNGNTILLPTKLKSTKEMTHNLANLVWALLNPGSYEATVGYDGIGLGGYDYKYNGKDFCESVAEQWRQKGIWEKLFNRTYNQMKQMTKLNFYYEGYHFTPKIHLGSSNLGCATVMGTEKYEPKYVTTYNQDSEKNLEMKEKGAGFDMRRYCSDPEQEKNCASSGKAGYAPAQQFTSTTGYWIVRQKTSSDIAGTFLHPSVYSNLKNTADIYRYNAAYGVVVGKDTPVEVQKKSTYEQFGSICPGTILQDEEGSRWLCYSDWADMPGSFTTKDHKARLISFDNIQVQNSTKVYFDEAFHDGFFLLHPEELLPFEEAPACAAILSQWVKSKGDGAKQEMVAFREKIDKILFDNNKHLTDWETERDSALILNNVSYPGFLTCINVAYYDKNLVFDRDQSLPEDDEDRYAYGEFYLRCVVDNSGLGGDRVSLPKGWLMPRLRYFRNYSHDRNRLLALSDTYRDFHYITEGKPVPADEFSRARRSDTGKRDGDFTVKNCWLSIYNANYYNDNPKETVTPYREKVFVLRYREFDDPSNGFRSVYGGKKYTILYEPKEEMKLLFRLNLSGQMYLSSGHNPGTFDWCTMDGKKFEMGYYKSNTSWPTVEDEANM